MKRIRDEDLISNNPTKDRVRWNTFVPERPLPTVKSRGIVRRGDGPIIPAIHPYTHTVSQNPLNKSQNSVLPSIQPFSMKSKAWKNIVFVLGGPGSGKGTQCAMLAKDYNYAHISVGDLLRQEVAKGSLLGNEIEQLMNDGQMIPSVSHYFSLYYSSLSLY